MRSAEGCVMVVPRCSALVAELDVIASEELGDVLDAWPVLSEDQAGRLRRYLVAELDGYGLLSVEKARECGQSLGRERAEARRVLRVLS